MIECYFSWCRWHEEQEYGPRNAEPFCTRSVCVASKENLVKWAKARDDELKNFKREVKAK